MIAPDHVRADLPLVEFFREVYKPLRLTGAAYGSIQQFEIAITAFGKRLDRPPTLADLSEEAMCDLMSSTVAQGLSPVTANMRARHLLALWRLAKRKKPWRDFLPADSEPDAVDFLKAPKRQPVAWTFNEMELMLQSARLARGRFMGVPAGKFWEAFLLVMYDTGLRMKPCFSIRFEEIDFASRMLRVPAERMKNLVEQYFRLHSQTIEAILATLPPRREVLFPWPFKHHRALYDRFRRILKRAGLPFTKRDMFHKIRRTTASHIARLAGEQRAIQQLGHQDQGSIKRYIDPRFTSDHEGARILPRPSWESPKEIEVEQLAPAAESLSPVTVRYSQDDLKGSGEDVLRRLRAAEFFTGADVREALAYAGIQQRDFAAELGVSISWLSRIMNGKRTLSEDLENRIRLKLGLKSDRNESDRDRKGGVS